MSQQQGEQRLSSTGTREQELPKAAASVLVNSESHSIVLGNSGSKERLTRMLERRLQVNEKQQPQQRATSSIDSSSAMSKAPDQLVQKQQPTLSTELVLPKNMASSLEHAMGMVADHVIPRFLFKQTAMAEMEKAVDDELARNEEQEGYAAVEDVCKDVVDQNSQPRSSGVMSRKRGPELALVRSEKAVRLYTPTNADKDMSRCLKDSDRVLSDSQFLLPTGNDVTKHLKLPSLACLSSEQGKQDCVGEKIKVSVVGDPIQQSHSKDESKASSANSSKLVALHWTPLSKEEITNTVWQELERSDPEPGERDVVKLLSRFKKKKTTSSVIRSCNGSVTVAKPAAGLLKTRRANNIDISLKAFKGFSQNELAETIAFLDPLQKLQCEQVQLLKRLLPTRQEIRAINNRGDVDRLGSAEEWFLRIADIKRIDTKVQVIETMASFQSEVLSMCQKFQLLADVCKQVMDSRKLKDLLDMILRVGNIMNEGTQAGGATGFKFDSLLCLINTKSTDGSKTTVLDYIVDVFIEKGLRESLNLLADFPQCYTASRMSIGELVANRNELEHALKTCENELEVLKDEVQQAERVSINTLSAGFCPREAILASITKKPSVVLSTGRKSGNGIGPKDKIDLQGAVSRLEHFQSGARESFKLLEQAKEVAVAACGRLSVYCGESVGPGATSELLCILHQFSTLLAEASKKYDLKQEAERRQQKLPQPQLLDRIYCRKSRVVPVNSHREDDASSNSKPPNVANQLSPSWNLPPESFRSMSSPTAVSNATNCTATGGKEEFHDMTESTLIVRPSTLLHDESQLSFATAVPTNTVHEQDSFLQLEILESNENRHDEWFTAVLPREEGVGIFSRVDTNADAVQVSSGNKAAFHRDKPGTEYTSKLAALDPPAPFILETVKNAPPLPVRRSARIAAVSQRSIVNAKKIQPDGKNGKGVSRHDKSLSDDQTNFHDKMDKTVSSCWDIEYATNTWQVAIDGRLVRRPAVLDSNNAASSIGQAEFASFLKTSELDRNQQGALPPRALPVASPIAIDVPRVAS